MVETPNPDWVQSLHAKLIRSAVNLSAQNTEEPDSSKSAILDGLVDIYGKPVGRFLVSTLVSNPRVRRLVGMGQPGSGKTITLSQINAGINDEAQATGIAVSTIPVSYDDLLRRYSRRKTRADTPEFNHELAQEILNPRKKRRGVFAQESISVKEIILAEVPAVGYTREKDRGVSTFEEIAPQSEDTLYLYLIAHPSSQINALSARLTAAVFPADEVVDALMTIYN